MTPLLGLIVKATALLAVAFAAAGLLRRAPAMARHHLWTGASAAILTLPLLMWTLPALDMPAPWVARPIATASSVHPAGSTDEAQTRATATIARSAPVRETPAATSGPAGPSHTSPAFTSLITRALSIAPLAFWVLGTLAGLGAVMLSLWRVGRLVRRAQAVTDTAWREAADAMAARLGVGRVRLLRNADVRSPMAGGVWRPTVFLPAASSEWSAEWRDVVLAHEIVHLAARDPLRHLVARLTVALYWFHPLAWIAARRGAIAREQACDESVLALGTRPSAYARVLLDLASVAGPMSHTLVALPMAQRAHLEARLMAILSKTKNVRPLAARRQRLVGMIAIAAVTCAVAATRPVPVGAVPAATPPAGPAAAPAAHRAAVAPAPALAPAPQTDTARESACWWDVNGAGSFSGSLTTNTRGGRTEILEQAGYRGVDHIIQRTLGDLRVCMLAEDAGERNDAAPSTLIGRVPRLVLEVQRGSTIQRLEVTHDGAGTRTVWQVNGRERAFDGPAVEWRDRMLPLVDSIWELSTLQGRVSTLRGQISSIRGEESSLRGQISSLQGQVSSMRGQISSLHGQESTLDGEVSSIQGQLSSLQGMLSSERGAISSLQSTGYGASNADRQRLSDDIARHQAKLAQIEKQIRDFDVDGKIAAVNKRRSALDTGGQAAAIESQTKAFDLAGKTAAINDEIRQLDVAGKTAAIEKEIQALDADRRVPALEGRIDDQLHRLTAAVSAIK